MVELARRRLGDDISDGRRFLCFLFFALES